MHTERFRNVHPTWIAFGWFLAAASTAAAVFALIALGILGESLAGGEGWIAFAFALGFAAGGFFTGARVGVAPILHGIGIGLFSLVAWLAVNFFFGEPTGTTTYRSLSSVFVGLLLLLQTAAAALGAWFSVRWARVRAGEALESPPR